MSFPRPILPDAIYLITRRCAQRQFLLRPDDETNQAFLYCLAEAAQRFEIELIGWLAMSNHYHAVVRDPRGRLPDFACHFHQMVAKCLNAHRARCENFWSSDPPSYTRLVHPADLLGKLVYTLLNPVEDHLVDSVVHWPGASSWPLLEGRTVTIRRPRLYFRVHGSMPKQVTLRTVAPPGESNQVRWAERVRAAVREREAELRSGRGLAGVRVVGRKRVRSTSPLDRAKQEEPRRKLRPLVACRDKLARITELEALKRFRVAYREARARFMAGVRDVLFPAGTFALRRLGVRCSSGSFVPPTATAPPTIVAVAATG